MSQRDEQLNPSQLNHDRIKRAFESFGYSERDYISILDLRQFLDKLSGEEFSRDVLEQLWEQCKMNSQGNTKITNFIDNLVRAEAILIQKQRQAAASIKSIEQKLSSQLIPNSDKMDLNLERNQLIELKAGFSMDLQTLRKPFLKFAMDSTISNTGYPGLRYTNQVDASVYNPLSSLPIPIENKQNLAWLFYLCCIGILADILVYLYLNAFMNTVLFLMILSLFFYEHFDRRTIRFLFWFTCFTLVVDIVWFVVAAKNVWHTHEVGLWPKYLNGYLKLCVIVIAVVSFLKIVIGFLLCSEYNIDETQPQQISILGKKFILKSTNTDAPLKKALFEFWVPSANKQQEPAKPPSELGQ